MKKVVWILISIFALTLAACGSSAPTAIPTVSLDNSGSSPSNTQASVSGTVAASAVVIPLDQVSLSFTTVGRVTAVNVKVGDKVKAGDTLVQIDTTILQAKVREAEANLAATQLQVKYLIRVGTDEKHLELAQVDVQRAQALLDSANATLLVQSSLAAPFDGTIVSVDTAVSETVTPGKLMIVLGDLSRYRIETTDLSERDITSVKIGQSANVFIEALNQEFAGKIVDVSHISSKLGGDVVYKVTIELDEQPQGLLWGMSANVKIETGS
jgi:RND family efflux transporter MFP subunit